MEISLNARIKICIFKLFPTYSKVGVERKIFIKYELLLKAQNCVLNIYLLRTNLNLGIEKKSSKVKSFGVVNSAIRAIFIIRQYKKNWRPGAGTIFVSKILF